MGLSRASGFADRGIESYWVPVRGRGMPVETLGVGLR